MKIGQLSLFSILIYFSAHPSVAQSDFLFESATLGPPGQTGGYVVSIQQFLGAKFEIRTTANVTELGGHLAEELPPELFVAVVPLDPTTDFPGLSDLSDALFATIFTAPLPSDEISLAAKFQLSAGRYGILFGSGLFGATGEAAMPTNNPNVGDPEYFVGSYEDPNKPVWFNGGPTQIRFFVKGNFEIFSDGFESGDTTAWSSAKGGSRLDHLMMK